MSHAPLPLRPAAQPGVFPGRPCGDGDACSRDGAGAVATLSPARPLGTAADPVLCPQARSAPESLER